MPTISLMECSALLVGFLCSGIVGVFLGSSLVDVSGVFLVLGLHGQAQPSTGQAVETHRQLPCPACSSWRSFVPTCRGNSLDVLPNACDDRLGPRPRRGWHAFAT